MKITKKELLSSALFLLGLLGLLMLSSWFFRPKNTAEAYGMEDWEANAILAEAENTIDVRYESWNESQEAFYQDIGI